MIIFADCLAERETNGIVAGSSIVGIQIPAIQQMAPTIQQMNPTVQQNSQAVVPSGDPMLQLQSSLSPIL